MIGTIGRIIYLGLWLGLLGLLWLGFVQLIWGHAYTGRQLLELLTDSVNRDRAIYLALFCGLELGAMSHYLSDWVASAFKRSPLMHRWRGETNLTPPPKSKKVPLKQAKKSRVK